MASINHTRILGITQRQAQHDIRAMFQRMSDELRGVLLRNADLEGNIPFDKLRQIRTVIAPLVSRHFVGTDGRNAFDEQNRALSPYASILNRHLAKVQGQVILAHTRWLNKRVPQPLLSWMQKAQAPQIQEQFSPNPLAQFEHTHQWLDSRGYELSDRIWGVSTETRRKIDLLLAEHIRNGDSAVNIAKKLEQFLLPHRAKLRTRRPYGTDGSFDAMRLARSEITAAHGRAAKLASGMNPFVNSMDWNLSPQHPKTDICDDIAAKSPYPVNDCPVPMVNSHAHCMCYLTSNVTSNPASVINDMNDAMMNDEVALLNPSNPSSLLHYILGNVLYDIFVSEISQEDIDLLSIGVSVGGAFLLDSL